MPYEYNNRLYEPLHVALCPDSEIDLVEAFGALLTITTDSSRRSARNSGIDLTIAPADREMGYVWSIDEGPKRPFLPMLATQVGLVSGMRLELPEIRDRRRQARAVE